MIRKNAFLSLCFIGMTLAGCKDKVAPTQEIATTPLTFTQEAEAYLVKPEGDTIQHLKLEIADDEYQRETGLMYRESMETDQGMLFVFENEELRGFHMKNTYIPLDLLFIDAANKVVSISKNAQPRSLETIPSEVPAQYVLEINGGLADQWNLAVGDSLILHRE